MCPLNHSRLIPMKFHILGIPQPYTLPRCNLHFLSAGQNDPGENPSYQFGADHRKAPCGDAQCSTPNPYLGLVFASLDRRDLSNRSDALFFQSLWMLRLGICQDWFAWLLSVFSCYSKPIQVTTGSLLNFLLFYIKQLLFFYYII